MLDIGGLDEGFSVIGERPKCSDTHRHLKRYTTPDLKNLGTLSLKGKKEEMRVEDRKTKRMLHCKVV